MKRKNEEDFNLKSFMMSEAYQLAKEKIQNAINHNSQLWNVGNKEKSIRVPTNLLTPCSPTFTKTKEEKIDLKKSKYQWKMDLGTKENKREEIGRIFALSEIPNWNIKFSYLTIKELQRH